MKISVCIITLNEEKVIKRVLTCVKKFADEIILVDTGSRDNTVEIAKLFTDKIYRFLWVDDFSKARNYAFSKASCDYLFWIDADDVITDENINKIIDLKQSANYCDTYMFKYLCGFDENNCPSLTFYRERLIKNCELAKFEGFVHEVVKPFGKIQYVDIEIEHRKEEFKNSKRNLNLYKKRLPISNFSTRDLYYYAKEYFYLGYYKTAIKLLNRYLKAENKYFCDEKDTYLTLYECYKSLKLKSDVKILFKALESVGVDGEVLCKIGDYYLQIKDYKNAENYYVFALNVQKCDVNGFCKNEYYYLYPLLQLTFLTYQRGDVKRSLHYHGLCCKDYFFDKRVQYNQTFFNNLLKD